MAKMKTEKDLRDALKRLKNETKKIEAELKVKIQAERNAIRLEVGDYFLALTKAKNLDEIKEKFDLNISPKTEAKTDTKTVAKMAKKNEPKIEAENSNDGEEYEMFGTDGGEPFIPKAF